MSKPSGARVFVTGLAWMGSGIRAIEAALERIFSDSKDEILITAYLITSGADLLFEWMEAALSRGVCIRLVINRLDRQPKNVVARLLRISEAFPHFHLYEFTSNESADLHAKVIVADRCLALIGSSNLSKRGLKINHELSVLVDQTAAEDAARAIDSLLTSNYVVKVLNSQ